MQKIWRDVPRLQKTVLGWRWNHLSPVTEVTTWWSFTLSWVNEQTQQNEVDPAETGCYVQVIKHDVTDFSRPPDFSEIPKNSLCWGWSGGRGLWVTLRTLERIHHGDTGNAGLPDASPPWWGACCRQTKRGSVGRCSLLSTSPFQLFGSVCLWVAAPRGPSGRPPGFCHRNSWIQGYFFEFIEHFVNFFFFLLDSGAFTVCWEISVSIINPFSHCCDPTEVSKHFVCFTLSKDPCKQHLATNGAAIFDSDRTWKRGDKETHKLIHLSYIKGLPVRALINKQNNSEIPINPIKLILDLGLLHWAGARSNASSGF